jgi:hypothetical protein
MDHVPARIMALRAIFRGVGEIAAMQCHNGGCTSKGKRVMTRRSIQCAYGFDLKSRRDSTRVFEGAPKVFR